MTIKPKNPRFYLWRNGEIIPCYEVPKKKGGGMKPYSLKEARIDRALVSVTSVLSVIDKPELDNWRVSQAIHSALTLPREIESFDSWRDRRIGAMRFGYSTSVGQTLEHAYHDLPKFVESEDAFAERVLADAEAQATKAAEFGTRIHDAIAEMMEQRLHPAGTKTMAVGGDLYPFLDSFRVWANDNIEEVHAVEKPVGHPSIGVAGRMDLDCTLKGVGRCICDFKTQAIKDKPQFWSDWLPQLSIYAELSTFHDASLSGTAPRIMSIVIPSNEPGPIHTKLWTIEERFNGTDVFNHALEIWIYTRGNGYDPRH